MDFLGAAAGNNPPPWKVLLVDDEPEVHEVTRLVLAGFRFEGRPLQIVSGPERIEAGWWDADLAARDYFIARDQGGALLWIYRTRLAAPGGWFLQGRFA